MSTGNNRWVFDFSGGQLSLDFANTVSGSRARPTDRLVTYSDLLSWGRQAGVLTIRAGQRLGQAAGRRREDAAKTLADAVGFRETLFRLFAGVIHGQPPDSGDLAVLNAALSKAMARSRLVRTPGGLSWGWTEDPEALDQMLWPVARSAADLLVSPELQRIRKCAGTNCDWLFMDMSKNHSRRWCDMRECGNRAKARRYYERHRKHL